MNLRWFAHKLTNPSLPDYHHLTRFRRGKTRTGKNKLGHKFLFDNLRCSSQQFKNKASIAKTEPKNCKRSNIFTVPIN